MPFGFQISYNGSLKHTIRNCYGLSFKDKISTITTTTNNPTKTEVDLISSKGHFIFSPLIDS